MRENLQLVRDQLMKYEAISALANDVPAWLLSLTLHVILLIVISVLTFAVPNQFVLTLTMPEEPDQTKPQEFHFEDELATEIGAASEDGLAMAMQAAPEIAEVANIYEQPDTDPLEMGDIAYVETTEFVTTPLEVSKKLVHGVAGIGVTGATGAIDRITHEILLSLEDRETLVVWLFDQSGSLIQQRREINDRLERIYEELGLIGDLVESDSETSDTTSSNTPNDQPLLTAVVGFGQRLDWILQKPTANVQEIQSAVDSIQLDRSGIENVFSAVYKTAEEYKRWRRKRNVMFVVVSDEVGDDTKMLEPCVDLCRKQAIPVYVVGVPAAFGEGETELKWIDPDPKYDQSARWGRVNQGPESLRAERLQLPFSRGVRETMDSGFGPFALTRLCYQTGGIYFAIHPNRKLGRRVGRRETHAFTSHFAYFFDPNRMRAYRPEYVSVQEYDRRAKANLARSAVLRSAQMVINRIESPRLRFIKRDEAQFATELTEAQKAAAKLEPKLYAVYQVLKQGEEDREREESLRWQAAYDLAYGQTIAVMVRTRGYNEMLAKAKRGLKPKEEKNNTWRLVPDAELSTSSRLEREAKRAEEFLQRVVDEHPETPWAMLAQRELDVPLGWKWEESHTPTMRPEQNPGNNNNNPPTPRDEQRRMLPKGPPKRAVPKL